MEQLCAPYGVVGIRNDVAATPRLHTVTWRHWIVAVAEVVEPETPLRLVRRSRAAHITQAGLVGKCLKWRGGDRPPPSVASLRR